MSTETYNLPPIRNDFDGYDSLIRFYNDVDTKFSSSDTLAVVFGVEFDASMTGLLWFVIEKLKGKNVAGYLTALPTELREKWKSNGFFNKFNYDTTKIEKKHKEIRYIEIEKSAITKVTDYINEELLNRNDIPKMSAELHREFNKNIVEIINNAFEHGKTDKVICCGNYSAKENILEFSICNVGITIRQNVENYRQRKQNGIMPNSCIDWATEDGTTTVENISRGLGLYLLKQFFDKNGGRIQIVSDNEFWERKNQAVITEQLSTTFNGTIINFEFNLADTKAYCLAGE
jgi:hypothetical protein